MKPLVMRSLLFLVLFVFSICTVSSQEVCESPDESSEVDLNSITKCAITPLKNSKDKKSRQIRVRVSARRRVLKRKATASANSLSASSVDKSSIKTATAPVDGLSTSQIGSSSIKEDTPDLKPVIALKETKAKSSIERLKEKLSKEEVSKALRFTFVDRIPTFKGCERVKKNERSDCFNNEMINHISKHFNYPSEAVRTHLEGEVWVRFIIDKDGYVKNIKTLGPDDAEILNEEAVRVVSKLPRFKPAKINGKPTSTKYGFPINFSLEE
ncbi:energy transducer TonB [Tenacibaculum ovolyticum]|uniref:energy transducer TonB n=1 Tax=Tenacibaculum ovolyticum TaxID=104270 RepID=UPI003BA9586B